MFIIQDIFICLHGFFGFISIWNQLNEWVADYIFKTVINISRTAERLRCVAYMKDYALVWQKLVCAIT